MDVSRDLDVIILQCGQSWRTVRLIDSIRATQPWARLIIVDNGSPLADLEAARDALRHGDSLISNSENLGFARAINQGIRMSRAQWVCLQNNDTIMCLPGYERLIEHMENDPSLGLIGPETDNADSVQRGYGDGGGVSYVDGLIAFFCVIVRRVVFTEVGLLSEDYGLGYGEDNDYCIRVRREGWKLGVARDVFVHHDHHVTYRELIGDEGIDELGRVNSEKLLAKFGTVE